MNNAFEGYYFARYPIWYSSEMKIPHEIDDTLTEKENNLINEINLRSLGLIFYIVVFPEISSYLGAYEDDNDESIKAGIIAPPFLDIEPDSQTASRLIDSAVYGFDEKSLENQNDSVKNMLYRVASIMIYTNPYWDERYLFQFYALNEFCASAMGNKITFGKFVETNMEQLYDNFRIGKGKVSSYSNLLLGHQLNDESFLHYRKSNSQETCDLINSLTKDEIYRIISNENSLLPKMNTQNSDFITQSIVKFFKINETIPTDEVIDKRVRSIINKSMIGYDQSLIIRAINIVEKSYKYELFGNLLKSHFLDLLESVVSKLESYEILVFLIVCDNAYHYIDMDDIDKSGELMELVMNNDSFSAEDFVRFITESYLFYDGDLPHYDDWAEFIEYGNKLDGNIPASILMPIIINDAKVKNSVRRNVPQESQVKEILEIKSLSEQQAI